MLPFTKAQFFEVFGAFNAAIWPAPIIAFALGLLVVALVLRSTPRADRIVAMSLALMWLFAGIAYHWLHFSRINQAANGFAVAFVLQAGLLTYVGVRQRMSFGLVPSFRCATGLALMFYSAIPYPIIGLLLHGYPDVALFGVAPCPVVIFTLGCMLLTREVVPWWVLVIPILWSLIGGSAAILLDVPQDWVLFVAGAAVVAFEVQRHMRLRNQSHNRASAVWRDE